MSKVDPALRVSDFDYHLPHELIAQEPPTDRDGGRLLLVDRTSGKLTDLTIRDLPTLLREHDIVVLNNTRVIPARLRGRRDTGGAVELLLLNRVSPGVWEALAKPSRKLPPGAQFDVISRSGDMKSRVTVLESIGAGRIVVQFDAAMEHAWVNLGRCRCRPTFTLQLGDTERYQTVFSRVPGSAAAPTAGLHLSDDLLQAIHARGVKSAEVTLQIGLDTFRPVTVERVADHVIHREWCEVPG